MPITLTGTGTITGISAGGLPDGSIATADIADDAVTLAKLSATGTPGAGNFLRGDNSWQEAGGGKLLQTVHGSLATQYVRSSANASWVSVGLSASITPSSSSNYILIFVYTYARSTGSHNHVNLQIFRDSTGIGGPVQVSAGDNYSYAINHSLSWKDSLSSWSSGAIVYSLRGNDGGGDGGNLYVNRSAHGTSTETTATSSIILMEVSG